MIEFPLYVIRGYLAIHTEGPFKIITTHKNRYVLDLVNSNEPSYAKRRLRLLTLDLPYELYPVTKMITSFSGLIGMSGKEFYTNEGRIRKYKPTTFYNVEARFIESVWVSGDGYHMIKVKGTATTFKSPNYLGEKYAIIAFSSRKEFLLEFSDTKEFDGRKRIKI